MGLKISPQVEQAITKAQEIANNYGNSKEGFIKAVNDNGGLPSLQKAMKTLDDPKVASVLTALGYSPDTIRNAVNGINMQQQTPKNISTPNDELKSLEERLKRLK